VSNTSRRNQSHSDIARIDKAVPDCLETGHTGEKLLEEEQDMHALYRKIET